MITLCSVLTAITVAGTILDLLSQWKAARKIKREQELLNDCAISLDESRYSKLNNEDSVVDETPIVIKMLMCFSVYTNLQKLFLSQSPEKTGTMKTLDIFNGVRVMSMGWVILGHVFTLRVYFAPSVNLDNLADWYKNPKGAMIYGAEYAVDAFFWLSEFLVAYFFIMEYNAKNRMNWIYMFIDSIEYYQHTCSAFSLLGLFLNT
jgi:hypothetical protein